MLHSCCHRVTFSFFLFHSPLPYVHILRKKIYKMNEWYAKDTKKLRTKCHFFSKVYGVVSGLPLLKRNAYFCVTDMEFAPSSTLKYQFRGDSKRERKKWKMLVFCCCCHSCLECHFYCSKRECLSPVKWLKKYHEKKTHTRLQFIHTWWQKSVIEGEKKILFFCLQTKKNNER